MTTATQTTDPGEGGAPPLREWFGLRAWFVARGFTMRDANWAAFVGSLAVSLGLGTYVLGNLVFETIERHERTQVRAMFRIDPARTTAFARAATEACLRGLLPEGRQRTGFVSPLLLDHFIAGMTHNASWRTGMDVVAFNDEARAIYVKGQTRYNDSFVAMSERQRDDAFTVRHAIVRGADMPACINKRLSEQALDVFTAPRPAAASALRGTAAS